MPAAPPTMSRSRAPPDLTSPSSRARKTTSSSPWPDDFARAERIVKGGAMDIRSGNGFDVHAFGPGDHVWLCGVKIAHSQGLVGHSDADVGMHALTDAIYGALAEGDIGRHFPPSDPQWKGAASQIFLDHAVGLAARPAATDLGNCDVTLICERPKIGPHAVEMQNELARIMEVGRDPRQRQGDDIGTARLHRAGRRHRGARHRAAGGAREPSDRHRLRRRLPAPGLGHLGLGAGGGAGLRAAPAGRLPASRSSPPSPSRRSGSGRCARELAGPPRRRPATRS